MMKQDSLANQAWKWMSCAALGAMTMYLADPDRGKRRRALARDKVRSLAVRSSHALDVASRDLANRAQGMRVKTSHLLLGSAAHDTDDAVVAARVRSRLGRLVSHSHGIKVTCQQGRVCLNGPILASEKPQLMKMVASVPGVAAIEDQLHEHRSSGNVSALQGEPPMRQSWMQGSLPPGLRALATVGGGILSMYGMLRKSRGSSLLALAGAGLLARGLLNQPLLRSAQSPGQMIHLTKTIHIEASPETVFDIWSHYDNFPHFMSNVKEVRDLGNGRSHWSVYGPAGIQIEWNAVLTESKRPERLCWRTESDAPVQHTGEIHFEPELTGTRVTVHMTYTPPAGAVGHAVATLFGGNPKRQMDEDLMRMKTFIESGIAPHDAAQRLRVHPTSTSPTFH